ncbi:hypothetical protein MTYP_02082 [Methylophilaceae bacterium]|nr:hypothetical protein MTYP_02082 [Methylophilaceae bacterium]
MKILNLKQAAAFLHMHYVTLSVKANSGEIPAAKVAGKWVFIEDDLIACIRNRYTEAKVPPVHLYPGMPVTASGIASKRAYYAALGLSDCPQIHSPKPAARSGARHARVARQVAKGEAVELVVNSEPVAESSMRTMQGA